MTEPVTATNMEGDGDQPPDPTSFLAMLIMTGSAKNASATMDSLTGWLLAGFGAILGLIISQLHGLSAILSPGTVRWSGAIYILSMIPAFIAKIIAAALSASAAGAAEGMALGEKLATWGPLDTKRLQCEIAHETKWPLTWVNKKAMNLALNNDSAGLGRLARDRATLQMRLGLAQAALTAAAGLVLLIGLKGP